MMNRLRVLAFLAIVPFSSHASIALMSGGTDGGGGRGVVCYSDVQQQTIQSVELLDFYEGRILEGYSIPELSGDYKAIYNTVIKKSSSVQIERMLSNASTLISGFKFLPTGIRLNRIEDSSEIFIPLNCSIEQVVNFQGPSRIFIVKDFWDRLSETSKAGLLMHELIWFVERSSGFKTSTRARRTVARYFADNYDFGKKTLDLKAGDLFCSAVIDTEGNANYSHGTSIVISKNSNDDCRFQFLKLNGTYTYTKHEAALDICSDLGLFGESAPGMSSESDMSIQVFSLNDNVWSHDMRLIVDIEWVAGVHSKRTSIQISNREFPGFDEKDQQLLCETLTQDDIDSGFPEI